MAELKLTELTEASNVVSGDYIDVSKDLGAGNYLSQKVDFANVASSVIETANLSSTYALLDGSNQPFTGDLVVHGNVSATSFVSNNNSYAFMFYYFPCI